MHSGAHEPLHRKPATCALIGGKKDDAPNFEVSKASNAQCEAVGLPGLLFSLPFSSIICSSGESVLQMNIELRRVPQPHMLNQCNHAAMAAACADAHATSSVQAWD